MITWSESPKNKWQKYVSTSWYDSSNLVASRSALWRSNQISLPKLNIMQFFPWNSKYSHGYNLFRLIFLFHIKAPERIYMGANITNLVTAIQKKKNDRKFFDTPLLTYIFFSQTPLTYFIIMRWTPLPYIHISFLVPPSPPSFYHYCLDPYLLTCI